MLACHIYSFGFADDFGLQAKILILTSLSHGARGHTEMIYQLLQHTPSPNPHRHTELEHLHTLPIKLNLLLTLNWIYRQLQVTLISIMHNGNESHQCLISGLRSLMVLQVSVGYHRHYRFLHLHIPSRGLGIFIQIYLYIYIN